jgi:hypothetical protein
MRRRKSVRRVRAVGYVNRLIEDPRLDDEIDAMAARLERLEHAAITRAKFTVDGVSSSAAGEPGA